MGTLKQIEAARRNGILSRGPVTAEGKARSSRNAETHGIYGSHVVLATESQDVYDAIREDTISHYRPANEEELELVTDLIDCRWRLHRLITMERSALDNAIAGQTEGSPATRASNAFFALADNSRGLALLQRHERALRRAIHNAVDRLNAISGERNSSTRYAPDAVTESPGTTAVNDTAAEA